MKIVNLSIASVSIITFLVFAYFLIFTNIKEEVLYGNKRMILSVIFILYALFRIYRAYKHFKIQNDEE
jgi:hypothetical protein